MKKYTINDCLEIVKTIDFIAYKYLTNLYQLHLDEILISDYSESYNPESFLDVHCNGVSWCYDQTPQGPEFWRSVRDKYLSHWRN